MKLAYIMILYNEEVFLKQNLYITTCQTPRPSIDCQALPGAGDGEAMQVARLRLALVFVVVARWSKYLFVIYITFRSLYTTFDNF
jgi:hypothetical protein